ncbi:MAG: GNAT family N-acetyltransferase [Planctomycetota bacterium]|nr:MAG: GNAT family N-acetyltransferase [Planctomycetota bacterium]
MPPEYKGEFVVRELTPEDRPWVQGVLRRYWASLVQVTRGRKIQADELPGFVAMRDGEEVGLITYEIVGDQCEVVTHNSLAGHGGIGSCLLAAVRTKAREAGCKRMWLVTTNDNTPALRFYQRRDFDLVAIHRNAVQEARKLKPEIPDIGLDGIPIRHEIEMEYRL